MPIAFIAVISLGAYATGACVARRVLGARSSAVHPLEVLLVAGALAGIVLLRRPDHAVRYDVMCAVAMLLVGAAIAGVAVITREHVTAGTREFEDAGAEQPASAWKRWLNFSRAVVDYEFRLLLVACYLLIIGPMAIAFRLLRAKPAGSDVVSNWTPKSDTPSLDAGRRPF